MLPADQVGSLLLQTLRQAIACDHQVLFGVDSTSLLFNRLLALQEQHQQGCFRWLETTYLVNEPCVGITFPAMMRTHISALVLHDRFETSWGTSSDLFHPLSPRSYSRQYHEIDTPSGGILRACFARDGQWIAALEMHRQDSHRPFAPKDLAFMRTVAPLIGQALGSAMDWERAHDSPRRTSPEVTGILLISQEKRLQMVTPAAQVWLDLLREKECASNAHLPTVVLSALARVQVSQQQIPSSSILTWTSVGLLRIEASLANEDGSFAVILVPQRSSPQPEVPGAWPLTQREREACGLLLRGQSTRQIAATLGVSENTVESHCAHIYVKLGIHRRSELLALFFREISKRSLRG